MKIHKQQLSAEDKLIAARIKMILNQPFFGNIATRLELIETKQFPTAATDGYNFYYNEDFINKLTASECEWLMGHEAGHIVFLHFDRADGRNHNLWNISTDLAINAILLKNKIGSPIKGSLYEERFKNSYSEEIYETLKKEAPKNLQELIDRVVDTHLKMDENLDGSPKTADEIENLKNQIKQDIVAAAQQCEAGNVPIGMERLVSSITRPQLCWKEILQQRIKSKIKNDFTFMRPSKRSFHTGVYLPSMEVEDEVDICIAFDVSGSIDNHTISEFKGEIQGIVSEFKQWKIKLWSFDTEVYNFQEYSSDGDSDILSYTPKGGGGTDFQTNWIFMKKNDICPKLFIMFTDLYPFGSWGDPNYCETIFIGYNNKTTTAPFGETVYIE